MRCIEDHENYCSAFSQHVSICGLMVFNVLFLQDLMIPKNAYSYVKIKFSSIHCMGFTSEEEEYLLVNKRKQMKSLIRSFVKKKKT